MNPQLTSLASHGALLATKERNALPQECYSTPVNKANSIIQFQSLRIAVGIHSEREKFSIATSDVDKDRRIGRKLFSKFNNLRR